MLTVSQVTCLCVPYVLINSDQIDCLGVFCECVPVTAVYMLVSSKHIVRVDLM